MAPPTLLPRRRPQPKASVGERLERARVVPLRAAEGASPARAVAVDELHGDRQALDGERWHDEVRAFRSHRDPRRAGFTRPEIEARRSGRGELPVDVAETLR